MSREDVKKMLGENATDEQVSAVLNSLHQEKARADDLEKKLNAQSMVNKEVETKYQEIATKLDELEKEKMTEAEKLQLKEKEVEKNLAESRKTLSKAKAQEIFSKVGITDEEIINTVVSDNIDTTIANATMIANKFKFVQEETVKKTKEEIANLDVKPAPSNVSQGEEGMTLDKFFNMSSQEQEKLLSENPDLLNNL